MSTEPLDLEFHEVTADRWVDFARLFEGRGGPKNCWCMIYRADAEEARDTSPSGRRAAMERRVASGTPVGILAYLDGEPVAWCSVAPKETFTRLGAEDVKGCWSITCFFVLARYRRRGITARLLDAAIAVARDRGARSVEGYPVDPDSPSYRFGGFVTLFFDGGFTEVGRLGTRRHVMRRDA
jgi:GNAT superfamily N-acetyltransferase